MVITLFYNKPLDRVLDLIKTKGNKYNNVIKDKLLFKKQIKINNLSFNYEASNENISKNINLTINKGENLGIFGKTEAANNLNKYFNGYS